MRLPSKFVLAVASFSMTGSLASFAAETSPPVAGPEAPASVKAQEIVCKRVNVTGSRMGGQKVCQTAAEWERLQERTVEATRKMGTSRNATKGN